MAKRTLTFSTSYNPSISGYGGYDEWFLEDLSFEQINEFLDSFEKLIEAFAKKHGIEGGYSGSN